MFFTVKHNIYIETASLIRLLEKLNLHDYETLQTGDNEKYIVLKHKLPKQEKYTFEGEW